MKAGPERVRERLTEFLAAASERGELACPDAERAARIFLGAVLTNIHLTWLVLQNPPPMTRPRMRAHIDEILAMFMGHYAPACPTP